MKMTALHGTHAEYDMMQCQRLHYITQNQFALCTCTAFVAIHDSTLAKQQTWGRAPRCSESTPAQHVGPVQPKVNGKPGTCGGKGSGEPRCLSSGWAHVPATPKAGRQPRGDNRTLQNAQCSCTIPALLASAPVVLVHAWTPPRSVPTNAHSRRKWHPATPKRDRTKPWGHRDPDRDAGRPTHRVGETIPCTQGGAQGKKEGSIRWVQERLQSGYRPLEKRLGGKFWRVQTGWSAVGGRQK